MGTVCQLCGGSGFTVALIYCDNCQISAIHRYCLPSLPKTFEEYVVWLCEDCEGKVAKPDTRKESSCPLPGENDLLGLRTMQLARAKGRSKRKSLRESFRRKKKRNKQKLDPQKEKDVEEGQTGDKGTASPPKMEGDKTEKAPLGQACETQHTKNYNKGGNVKIELGSIPGESSRRKKKRKKRLLVPIEKDGVGAQLGDRDTVSPPKNYNKGGNVKIELGSIPGESSRRKKKQKKRLLVPIEKDGVGAQLGDRDTVSPPKMEGDITEKAPHGQACETQCTENYHKCRNVETESRLIPGDAVNSDAEAGYRKAAQFLPKLDFPRIFGNYTYISAQPIIDPIWRGSLSISNPGFNCVGKVVARLSCLACPNAINEAKLFPSLLRAELHSSSRLWPKDLKRSGPSDDSIALYLFPENESDTSFFDKLVKQMIIEDLGMRTVVTNAELRVFTSLKLPAHLWRFQSKIYLWGTFVKQSSCTSEVGPTRVEEELFRAVSLKTQSPVSPLSINGLARAVY